MMVSPLRMGAVCLGEDDNDGDVDVDDIMIMRILRIKMVRTMIVVSPFWRIGAA